MPQNGFAPMLYRVQVRDHIANRWVATLPLLAFTSDTHAFAVLADMPKAERPDVSWGWRVRPLTAAEAARNPAVPPMPSREPRIIATNAGTDARGLRHDYVRFDCSCGFSATANSQYVGPDHKCVNAYTEDRSLGFLTMSKTHRFTCLCRFPECPSEPTVSNGFPATWCSNVEHEDYVRAACGYSSRAEMAARKPDIDAAVAALAAQVQE